MVLVKNGCHFPSLQQLLGLRKFSMSKILILHLNHFFKGSYFSELMLCVIILVCFCFIMFLGLINSCDIPADFSCW